MNDKKIPMPPVPPSRTLYKSVEFWRKLLGALDREFQFMEENLCYGKISVEFKYWNGKMTDKTTSVIVNDRIVSEDKLGST